MRADNHARIGRRRRVLPYVGLAIAEGEQSEVFMKSFQLAVIVSSSVACLGALAACSGAPGAGSGTANGGEKTGMIVAAVTAPKDVMCIELQVTDYNGNGSSGGYYGPLTTYTDVTPGTNAVIQVGPLSPGYVYLSGDAFDVPCVQVEYPWEYGGSGVGSSGSSSGPMVVMEDGGVSSGSTNPTWEADDEQVLVAPGAATNATLTFHQFGSLNLNINFANCDPSSYEYQPWCYDSGFGEGDAGISSSSSSSSSGGSSSGAGGSSSGAGGSSSSSGAKTIDAGRG